MIAYCRGKVYIFGNLRVLLWVHDGIPHLHTLVRRTLPYGVESRLGTWGGGLKGLGGVKASIMLFGGTVSPKHVLVRLIETFGIISGGINFFIFN